MMYEPENIEEFGKNVCRTIEELEEENKRLSQEKANLLDIEAKLQAKVSEEVTVRKQENDELRLEIENLKKRCEKLTQFLNRQTPTTIKSEID
jgi:polyhydroxyalkanoate synthesis regulator phasin